MARRAQEIKEETARIRKQALKEAARRKEEKRVANRQAVADFAVQFVGNPYVYGGNSLTNGTDCSGFTMLVYANFGVSLPRSAPDQAYAGRSVGLDNIRPGDIVVSGYDGVVCHAALYIGNGQLVHALNSNVGIVVTSLYIMPIIDVRRVV